jgi:hypothetical protein
MRTQITPEQRFGPLSIEGADEGQGGGAGGDQQNTQTNDSILDLADGDQGTKDTKTADQGGDKGGSKGGDKPAGVTFESIPKEHQVLVDDGKGNKKPDLAASIVKAGMLDKVIPTKFQVKGADGKLDLAATLAKSGLSYAELEKAAVGKGPGWKVPEGVKALTAVEGDYALSVPEGVTGQLNGDDPLLKGVTGILKKYNAPQELVTELVHAYIKQEVADQAAEQVDIQAQFRALGENAGTRAKDARDWAKANLDTEGFQAFRAVSRTAGGFKLLETIMGMAREQPLHAGGGGGGDGGAALQAEIDALTTKGANGQRPIDTDQAKLARYRELLKLQKGTAPKREVVG